MKSANEDPFTLFSTRNPPRAPGHPSVLTCFVRNAQVRTERFFFVAQVSYTTHGDLSTPNFPCRLYFAARGARYAEAAAKISNTKVLISLLQMRRCAPHRSAPGEGPPDETVHWAVPSPLLRFFRETGFASCKTPGALPLDPAACPPRRAETFVVFLRFVYFISFSTSESKMRFETINVLRESLPLSVSYVPDALRSGEKMP